MQGIQAGELVKHAWPQAAQIVALQFQLSKEPLENRVSRRIISGAALFSLSRSFLKVKAPYIALEMALLGLDSGLRTVG